ncbi:MATE family efflux transporter [Paenibacillus sp. RC67]|uniref:MATE family efflux transporter n=1 Tax=Paenibacillus sp. RC67 TaxID=3039392 RepID=UPI0024AE523C|nr:MATE family efflux transporter [Paenibacillus sp. RC67]
MSSATESKTESKLSNEDSETKQVSEAVLIDPKDGKAIRRMIYNLAGPSLVEMLLINFAQMMNMIMVGRIGAEAVATVGLTSQPYMLLLVLFVALNTGTTVIVARAVGSGNMDEANRAAGQAFTLNILLSIIIVALSSLNASWLLQVMGANPDVIAHGLSYAKIIFLSIGFTTISSVLSAILRGAGDTRTPMKINVISNVVAVALGLPLIYGYFGLPAMGVTGAAVASIIAQLISTVWFVSVMISGRYAVRITWKYATRMDKAIMMRVLKIGLPTSGEQLIMRLGIATFVKISAGLGTVALAANQLVTSVIGLSFMPGMAFAVAASTLVGQALGAQKTGLAETYVWQVRKFGMVVAGVMGLVFMIFAPYILMLYTKDQSIIDAGTLALRIVGVIQVSQASQFILGGALRGAGDTKYPLYSTLIGVWGIRVVLSLLFVKGFEWGMAGLWSAVALDQFLRSNLIYWRFKRGNWKTIRL